MTFEPWFPLAREVIESKDFQAAPATAKLYYLQLVSRYNLQGPFYLPDEMFALMLRCNPKTIQRARRTFVELGWLEVSPGRKDQRGRGLATSYRKVRWAQPAEAEWFAQMHRYTFDTMIYRLHKGWFEAADVVTYVVLTYLGDLYTLQYRARGFFYVPVSVLRDLTGCYDATRRVKRLYEGFTFAGGDHLFEYSGYQQLKVSKWSRCADPEVDETNAKNAEKQQGEIEAAYRNRRAGTTKKQRRRTR